MFAELAPDERAGGESDRGAEESRAHYGAAAVARRIARRAELVAGVGAEEAQSDATDEASFEPIGSVGFRSGKSTRELEGGDGWERWRQPLRSGGGSAEQQADKRKYYKDFEHHPSNLWRPNARSVDSKATLMMLRSVVSVAAFAALLGPCDLMTSSQPPAGPVVGTWGGQNAGLMADDSSAHVHIGCTYGNVHQQIVPDSSGKFDVPGQQDITAYPVDRGILHPARFSGSVVAGSMTLVVTLTDTAVTLGPVKLVYGMEPRMGPCPICRVPRRS